MSPKAGKKVKEEGKKERPLSPSKVKIKYPRVKTRPLSGNRKGFILQARDSSPPVEKPKKVELTKEEEAERIAQAQELIEKVREEKKARKAEIKRMEEEMKQK